MSKGKNTPEHENVLAELLPDEDIVDYELEDESYHEKLDDFEDTTTSVMVSEKLENNKKEMPLFIKGLEDNKKNLPIKTKNLGDNKKDILNITKDYNKKDKFTTLTQSSNEVSKKPTEEDRRRRKAESDDDIEPRSSRQSKRARQSVKPQVGPTKKDVEASQRESHKPRHASSRQDQFDVDRFRTPQTPDGSPRSKRYNSSNDYSRVRENAHISINHRARAHENFTRSRIFRYEDNQKGRVDKPFNPPPQSSSSGKIISSDKREIENGHKDRLQKQSTFDNHEITKNPPKTLAKGEIGTILPSTNLHSSRSSNDAILK
ncbi:3520_t:CDS:1, partial [Ambispora leptoticha]